MVEERAREIHNALRVLARSRSPTTVQHDTSVGGHCDVCRREIRVGEIEHIVTTSFARLRLDDACLVIWTRERGRFTAEPPPEESEGR
jgi:hypothetical protein